jgi:hypothetical protein
MTLRWKNICQIHKRAIHTEDKDKDKEEDKTEQEDITEERTSNSQVVY